MFEAWLAMQTCSAAGLTPSTPETKRWKLTCIHNAEQDMDGKKIEKMIMDNEEVTSIHALLSSNDVTVTNSSDKLVQLPKVMPRPASPSDLSSHHLPGLPGSPHASRPAPRLGDTASARLCARPTHLRCSALTKT